MRMKLWLKRFLCIIISALIAFSAVACNAGNAENASSDVPNGSSQTANDSDNGDGGEETAPSVSFVVDGEDYGTLAEGDSMPTPPVKNGYAFDGWYDGDQKVDSLSDLDGDVTLTAKWSAVSYTITYENTKDVSHENAASFTVESGKITLAPLSKTGYVFDGWYNGETKVTEIAAGSVGNITLTARWSPIICNVTFSNTMGATNSNPASITVEDGVITLNPLSKDGYDFDGWYLNGNQVTQIKTDGQTAMTVEARWTKKTYGIFYANTKGVAHSNPDSYDVETETFTLAPLSKLGYEFDGWYYQGVKYTQIVKGTYGNLDLEARWNPIVCNITFINTLGAENQNPDSFTVDDGVITLKNLSKAGYEFDGWYVNGQKVTSIEADGTTAMTVVARWTKIPYTITYVNTKDAENSNPVTYDVETSTIVLSDLQKVGYRFDGWFDGNNRVTAINYGSIGNRTLEARWTIIDYTVTYEGTEGAQNDNPATYTVEDADIVLQGLTRDGYDFLGWFDGDDEIVDIDTASARNYTLTARWKLSEYEIVYENVKGAANPNPQSYTIETGKITLSALTLDGYTFDGWFIGDDEVTEIAETQRGKVTLTARWTATVFAITYENTGNQTHTNPATYTADDGEITLAPLENNSPAIFGGWYLDGELVDAIPAGTKGDITLVARWSIPVYDAEDLAGMTLGGDYVLMNDIDLEGAAWTPVGADKNNPFTGSFDGSGYTISNFVIENGDAYWYYVGLFGYVEGSIRNLNVENFTYNVNVRMGSYYIGGIAAYVSGGITDCSVNGNINVTRQMNGLYGEVYDYYGGLVGYLADNCEMENCSANVGITVTTNYTGYNYIGGMVGYAAKDISVKSSEAQGSINVNNTYNGAVGGIIGYAIGDADFTECSSEMDITVGNDSYVTSVGGIIGRCSSGTIDGCSYEGEIVYSRDYYYTYLNYVGGLAGITGIIKNSSANVTFSIAREDAQLYLGGLAGSATNISNCQATVTATLEDAYYYSIGGLVGNGEKVIDSHANVDINAGLGEVPERSLGGIAGSATEIVNCYATGTLNGGSNTGGIAGTGSTVKNSYFEGDVTGAYYVGGIVGRGETVSVITCYAEANVSSIGYGYAGGLVGLGNSEANVYNSYYIGDIVANAKYYTYRGYVGGLVGFATYGGTFNCYAIGSIDASANSSNAYGNPPSVTVGGVGSVKNIENCFVSMDIKINPNSAYYGTIEYGKIVYQSGNLVTVTNSYADDGRSVEIEGYSRYYENTYIDIPAATLENLKDDEWVKQNLFTSMNASWTYDGEYPELDFTADATVVINTAEELMALSGKALVFDYKLGADISLKNMTWTPMTVIGTLDGNGFTVSDLTLTLSGNGEYELGFIKANRGTVKNIKLENVKISGKYSSNAHVSVGGLVACNYGTVDNCSIDGTLDCVFNASRYDMRFGGLIGTNEGTVTNCSSTATVNSNYNKYTIYVGGLIGRNENGKVEKCSATGSVTSSYNSTGFYTYVGGLVGYGYRGEISRCYSTATVTASRNEASISVGGIVGEGSSLVIKDCYVSGTIEASVYNGTSYKAYVGGIAGYGSNIKNCYSTANITAGDSTKYAFVYAGGIAGTCTISALEDCYAAGTVKGNGKGNGYVGGLISDNTTLDEGANCYRVDGQTVTLRSGTLSDAGTVATLADVLEVMSQNWSADVWDFSTGTHPTLK